MGLLDKYLTLKNSLKLNTAVMEGVAKAISAKAEEEFKKELQDYCKQRDKYIERLKVLKGML